jgi:XTP/dITP diphosphohydrolase
MQTLLLATKNEGKLREIQSLLTISTYNLIPASELETTRQIEPEENASTFEGNALIKAYTYAQISGLRTVAEDSGLEVDALQGEPGVHSARWIAGTDADRNAALVARLEGVPEEKRTARYRAVVAIVDPQTLRAYTCFGMSEGRIVEKPRGENGFGYDPIFLYNKTGKTGALMSQEEKNSVSHRKEAWLQVQELLEKHFDNHTS